MSGKFTGSRMTDERQARAVVGDLDRRVGQVEQADVLCEGGRRLILRSPNGHFWSVGVDNAGVLTTTDMGTTL